MKILTRCKIWPPAVSRDQPRGGLRSSRKCLSAGDHFQLGTLKYSKIGFNWEHWKFSELVLKNSKCMQINCAMDTGQHHIYNLQFIISLKKVLLLFSLFKRATAWQLLERVMLIEKATTHPVAALSSDVAWPGRQSQKTGQGISSFRPTHCTHACYNVYIPILLGIAIM